MKEALSLTGALLTNLILAGGLIHLPSPGTGSLENVFVLVWLSFGLLINLGFTRDALRYPMPLSRQRNTRVKGGFGPDRLRDSGTAYGEDGPRVRPGAVR